MQRGAVGERAVGEVGQTGCRERGIRGIPGSPASSTRPMLVANAGNRVPIVIRTLMMRRVGTRAM